MNYSETGAQRRLARLERVRAGRQARLASTLASPRRRRSHSGPIDRLQRYGYPLAILLAVTAVLPMVIGLGWGHRRLLAGAAANGLAIHSLRKRFEKAQFSGRDR